MTLQKSTSKILSKKTIKCPNCGIKRTTEYDGKIVCTECSSIIDLKSIKNKKPNTKPQKYMPPTSPQTNNMKGIGNIDLGEADSKKWRKMLHVSDATEKRLATTLFEITKIGQSMSIPESTLKNALEIYRKIINSNLTRRKPIRVLAATIVYIACRQTGIAASLNEIAHQSKINPQIIRHVYNSLSKRMKPLPIHTASDLYVNKLATALFEREKTIATAETITCTLQGLRFAQGKNPVGLAASACYIASILVGESKTQREIAELCRITEATMRTRYKEMSEHLLFKVYL